MQKDLAVWLKEAYTIDGEWTIAEKKRYLNRGCVAVAAATLSIESTVVWEVTGVASTNEIVELALPARIIQPKRLFVDGLEYKEVAFDEYLDNVGGIIDPPSGSVTSASGQYSVAFRLNRFFYWDQAKNVFQISPRITDTQTIELYAVMMPNLLINDDDVSTLNPIFTHLVSAWAAWKMLPQDEEHRDRGRDAQRDYITGLRDFEKYKRKRKGNIAKKIIMDQGQFGSKTGHGHLGMSDLGTLWDRL
tara:strand:+ start:611 stop:1351 length:741 start_codon:yes stop_codon:yes gene_type:complete